MRKKAENTTIKERLINAAWELFLEKGYDATTVNEIIERSQTSRGSFYHHFRGKEDLIFSLAYFFDNDYDKWLESLSPDLSAVDKLIAFDEFILDNLEHSPYISFFQTLYGLQVMTQGTRYILNPKRRYYQILNQLVKEGFDSEEIISSESYTEISEKIASLERGLTYDWCLQQQRYSLLHYGHDIVCTYLESLRAH
ncbi:TetR/AcrR family transcriptional regulator [Faecalimonas sp.]